MKGHHKKKKWMTIKMRRKGRPIPIESPIM
jgi:hypothetical protein